MNATLAVSMPVKGAGPREAVDLARRAGDWGYSACWASEVQGPDAFTLLGALAVATDLQLGVAVVPVQTRSTMVLGMSAVTLAQLSGGRFALGVGASSEQIVSRWAGEPYDAPLTQVRETVEALRPILRGERASYDGRFVQMGGYKPHAEPPAPIPLFVGALNQKSLRQVGEIADGVCLNQLPPGKVPMVLDEVREGAKQAGRDLDEEGFAVMARLFCAVTDDVPAARKAVKREFAPYVATSGYNRFYRWLGYEEEAEGVAAAAEEGDREAMVEALSDRLVDEVFVLGDADEVSARVHDYVDNGVTTAAISVLSPGIEEAEKTLRAVAERWSPGQR